MPVFTDYPTFKGTSLSDLLGTVQGVQNFQQQQQLMPLQLEKAQLELERQRQTQNPEIERIKSLSRQQLGTEPETITQQQELAKQAKISTEKSIFDLSKEKSNELNKIYSSLIGHPGLVGDNVTKDSAAQALHEADLQAERLDLGEHKDVILKALTGPLYGVATKDPRKLNDVLININKQAMTPSERQQFVSGTEKVESTDIYGNPTVIRTNPYTGKKEQAPLAVAPKVNANQMRFAPGESAETLKAFQEQRNEASMSAAASAPAINNIDTVLKYLPLAQTGKYSDALAGLQSAFGNIAGSTKEELAASARDIIQKNIADLSLQKNTALGGKFVADLQTAQQSLADAGKNPTAIIKSMEQLRPLIQHAQLYQQGLEKTIDRFGGDVQVKRKYDNAMIRTFDPEALIVYNAYAQAGDEGVAKATSKMSASKKAQIFQKIKDYSKLVNGDL
jgi:hypothetical protein